MRSMLDATEVTRLGSEQTFTTSIWNFIESQEVSAPFTMGYVRDEKAQTKIISLNKVACRIAGEGDRLFVVRDLSSLAEL